MLLVAAMLVVVFGEFRFASESKYHATFTDASRLKAGQDVRIAGVPVGTVGDIKLNPDNTVDVSFDVAKRYQLYTSTRAVVRYENLVGDRYLEITAGPGELRKISPGSTLPRENTQPALDLDALLGRTASGAEGSRRREDQRGQQRGHGVAARARAARCPTCCPPQVLSPRTWRHATSSSAR